MAQKKLINDDELKAIHSVLEKLDAIDLEDFSGDWLANLQMTDFSTLMGHLPKMAAKTANGTLQNEIGYLSSLLYTIAMYKDEIRMLSAFLDELHKAAFVYYDFNSKDEK